MKQNSCAILLPEILKFLVGLMLCKTIVKEMKLTRVRRVRRRGTVIVNKTQKLIMWYNYYE